MKVKFCVLFILFAVFCHAQEIGNAAKHVGAGVVIGGVGGYAAHKIFYGQRGWTWAGAVSSSLAAGLAKEALYDQPRGAEWESRDVFFTTLGGIVSGLALDLLLKNSRGRRGGGKRGNCGCLVAAAINQQTGQSVLYFENGSRNITSVLEASYLLK
jgi:hypothetical protein